ncbi:unnamed protein product, partial [Polarella glacialis]
MDSLSILLNFKFFQELDVGLQTQLSSIVQKQSLEEGEVLFRQGDPPGKCYVVLDGEVNIFVRSGEELDPETDSRTGTPRVQRETSKETSCSAAVLDEPLDTGTGGCTFLSEVPFDTKEDPAASGDQSPPSRQGSKSPASRKGSKSRKYTIDMSLEKFQVPSLLQTRILEPFSVFHSESSFGAHVATISSGSLLGELALMNDAHRSASAMCATDCNFLVIHRHDFDSLLKADR